MKIVYAGAPEFSVRPLEALLDAGEEVVAVVTQPDKPAGRKARLTPTPLKTFALGRGIPVYDFARIRDNTEALRALGAQAMVTCAYGQILTAEVLGCFPAGVYNIHASLLPRWRGASPIQHALLAGDAETGITVMRTDVGLDTGDMLLCERTPIDPSDTAATLSERLSRMGGECIVRALSLLSRGEAVFVPQAEEGACLCRKIAKERCVVDFSRGAREICDLIRAMNPAPLAFAYLHGKLVNFYFATPAPAQEGAIGEIVRMDKTGVYVRAADGCVRIERLQPEGGKPMSAADFVNGRKAACGELFGVTR